MLDAGIGGDWRQVAARWEEGIGRNSHTLELEELGGFQPRYLNSGTSACILELRYVPLLARTSSCRPRYLHLRT